MKNFFSQKSAGFSNEQIVRLVAQIEKSIFEMSIDQKKPYSSIAREKWLILNDAKNSHIVKDLTEGLISIENFVYLNAGEILKNSEQKKIAEQQKQYQMESLQADFYVKNIVVNEGEFQCLKCKSRKISTH